MLIVGAGPTGLTLAAQLQTFGARLRIIDRLVERRGESRALAVQPRSLEVLQNLGLADRLVERGRTGVRALLHFGRRARVEIPLGDVGLDDTRFPFILFVSQAATERVLSDHLHGIGVTVERGVELKGFEPDATGVNCTLQHLDGRIESIRVAYLAGCDGAHSTVRERAGIPFHGDSYPQEFVLGDVEIDGSLEPDAVHVFPEAGRLAMIFPLGRPSSWRIIGMDTREGREARGRQAADDLSLEELQAVTDAVAGGQLRLRDPTWLARFLLHHRQTERYRDGRIFLAGDAAHIHSPVGAQGMNTGIQDAWNLGWKLGLVTRGVADEALLDSYHAERWPVGRLLLRVTDRVFSAVLLVMRRPAVFRLWRAIAARLLPFGLKVRPLRARVFRWVSQLGIRYRGSPAVEEAPPYLYDGPRAGDRLPDAAVLRHGRPTSLLAELSGPHLHLLLCGAPDRWDARSLTALRERFGELLAIQYLTRRTAADALTDARGEAFARLGVEETAHYLVRPDGHVGFRSGGTDLRELTEYLDRWFPGRRGRT